MSDQYNACRWLVDRHVDEGRSARTAIRIAGTSLTYGDVHAQVQSAAAGLRELGVRPEERVALVLLDGVEFVSAFLGAMRMGAVPVAVNPGLRPADVARVVADSRARVAVVS